ncbi:IS66 family insertion sequence element accessory protein TnpA, partial [Ureibacillus thermophilus]
MPKNPELRKVWEQRIADYRKSGQTQVNWCKENQWSIHQFKYWLRKIENPINNQGKSTKWASVTLEDHSQTVENSLRIEISGISI